MTPKEVAELLAEMTATWPQREMTKPEAMVWHDDLKGRQAHLACQAVRDLRTVCDWLPTHSQFISAYQAAARREALERPGLPEAPPEGTTNRIASREHALAAVRQMRANLRSPGARAMIDGLEGVAKRQPSRTEAE